MSFSHAPVQLDPASETTYMSLAGQALSVSGLDAAIGGKQPTLPANTLSAQGVLADDGSGNKSWIAPGGSLPGWIASTYDATFHNIVDQSAISGCAFWRLTLDALGTPSYISLLSIAMIGSANDVVLAVEPASDLGWTILEATSGAGLVLQSRTTAGAVNLVVGRGSTPSVSCTNGVTTINTPIKATAMPTSDPGDGASFWCDTENGYVVKLSVLSA